METEFEIGQIFLGRGDCAVDSQRRFAIPKDWRDDLCKCDLFLFPGRDGALLLLTPQEFSQIVQNLKKGSLFNADFAFTLGQIGSLAQKVSCDKQGRIAIPKHLQEISGISDRLLAIGAVSHIQLWDPERWQKLAQSPDKCLDVLEKTEKQPDQLSEAFKAIINR